MCVLQYTQFQLNWQQNSSSIGIDMHTCKWDIAILINWSHDKIQQSQLTAIICYTLKKNNNRIMVLDTLR